MIYKDETQVPAMYLRIDEDRTLYVHKGNEFSEEDLQMVENETLHIVRITPFSAEAQALSGRLGRMEVMVAEGTVEEAIEENPEAGESGEPEDDGVEAEPEIQWAVDWESI